jgi:transposase-like protein
MKKNIADSASVMTDGFASYDGVAARFKRHEVINHSAGDYARSAKDGLRVHTNTVEGFFGLLKRGLNGTYHHVDAQHLHRYLSEFDFRYNNRGVKDSERAAKALAGTIGKRLTLREPKSGISPLGNAS